jgi:hypothetical protein
MSPYLGRKPMGEKDSWFVPISFFHIEPPVQRMASLMFTLPVILHN